jgi:hypothetical protein
MPKLFDISSNSQQNVHVAAGRDSGIAFVDSKVKDPNGSLTPEDRSFSVWQNAWSTLIKIFQGNITMSGSGNITLNAGGDIHQTTHNKQTTVSGGNASYTKGESIHIKGEISQDERAKLQQYHAYLDQMQAAYNTAFQNTPGEQIACPNCAQEHLADTKSDSWNIILDTIRQYTDGIPWTQGPFGVLKFIITKVYVALLGVVTNLGLNGGKGCGPGCNNGLKVGLSQPLNAAQNAVTNMMQDLAPQMNALTASMNSNSGEVVPYSHGVLFVIGDPQGAPKNSCYNSQTPPTYHNYPSNLRPSSGLQNKLRVTTEGNCKQVVYTPPLQSPFGNMMMNVQNNIKITCGNAGMDLLSTGEIAIKGGSVHINGSQGEVSVTSSNLTTIGGANVLISADPKTGESGFTVDSKHTFINGAFNVKGDSAMLGSLTVDGALHTNYINCPAMAAPSTLCGTDSIASHGANWSYEGLALNELNFDTKLLNLLLQPGSMDIYFGITVVAMETYNLAMMALPIEAAITGEYLGYAIVDDAVGISFGYVFNYPHNHSLPPGDHTHETPVPRGGFWKRADGAGMQRSTGNPAPTPAPTSGTFPSPAPRCYHGGCGGGGLFSKVRNETYGINSDDAFNNGNFVTTTVVRNPDGSIYPPPDLTYRVVNDHGSSAQPSLSGTAGVTC